MLSQESYSKTWTTDVAVLCFVLFFVLVGILSLEMCKIFRFLLVKTP